MWHGFGELETVSGDSRDMRKNVRGQGDGCTGRWSWGSGGRTLHHVFSLTAEFEKNKTAYINPAIFWQTAISTHRKPTHAHPSSTWKCTKSKLWAGTFLLGGHCATEYIMHMYSFCSRINMVYITGRTILFSLSSSWRTLPSDLLLALQQEP